MLWPPFNPTPESSTRTYGVINGETAREINRFAFNANNKIIRHPAATFDSCVSSQPSFIIIIIILSCCRRYILQKYCADSFIIIITII